MNLDIFNLPDTSGKFSKESFLIKNFPEEYSYIIEFGVKNNLIQLPFKERVYLAVNFLVSRPVCKNPNCNEVVSYKNSTIGYLDYCSVKCISSDPNIKKIKENKSLSKFGTKAPAQSKVVKDRIVNTNRERYGGNSPMSSMGIQNKSKQTLLKNWNVTNPSMSINIIEKRVDSFKLNIEKYKESYSKTSIKRYGVDHPWKSKEIHNKSMRSFQIGYSNRIKAQVEGTDVTFIDFKFDGTKNLIFNCKRCGFNFEILPYQFYYRIHNSVHICTNCFPISESSSIDQLELYNFIVENYDGIVILNDKKIISPYEVDIYLPDLNIGFEFNGVFWHSAKFKDNLYHLKKYNKSLENNINIYTIWEDDWFCKRNICKSFILNKLNKSIKIYARKCDIREVSYNESKLYLESNHLQGNCSSSIRIGLYYNDSLCSLMTFSKLRLPLQRLKENRDVKFHYELTRFASIINHSVVGGASKLFKYFLRNFEVSQIETYSDNLISNGDIYLKLGFNYSHTSKPGYWYLVDGIREHRFNWRKQKLVKLGYDPNKTEEEIMLEIGYYRIYNAGNKKWILNS